MGKLREIYKDGPTKKFYDDVNPLKHRWTTATNLVYDEETKIIYYKFNDNRDGSGYMSPYISENGKYCRFIDGEIVEVD